jgi:hypothetical protein
MMFRSGVFAKRALDGLKLEEVRTALEVATVNVYEPSEQHTGLLTMI